MVVWLVLTFYTVYVYIENIVLKKQKGTETKMTETQHRPMSETPDQRSSEIETLNKMFNAPEASTSETADNSGETREISPLGSTLVRAAERVSSILEARAINKAHGEALKEYRDRDHSDYVDHIASLAESTEATPMAQVSAQMALEREYRIADREQLIADAKDKLRGFGNSALRRLKSAGLIGLGIGIIGAEAGAKSAKKGAELASEGARFAGKTVKTNAEVAAAVGKHYVGEKVENAKEKVTATWDKAEAAAGRAGARMESAIDNGIDKVTGTIEAAKEALEYRRQAAIKRKEAALTRKYERHAGWMKLKRKSVETVDRARELTVEQKRKIGRFAARAKASGEAAVEAWKSN